jgi:hypothetical protein
MSSKFLTVNKEDLIKVLKGLGIAVAGVVLTYLEETIPGIDFGSFTPVVYALNSTLVNLARKWLAGYSK